MKSSKIWKIIWVIGIYAILGIILYLVILYKVEWESKDLNTYLYFYDCNRELCTTTTKPKDYYSKVLCEEEMCPYITNIINNNLILENNNENWIYNYIDGEIINNNYKDYRYIGNDTFIVTDSSNNQGVIDISGNILVEIKYKYIDNYKNGFISYKINNMYGIDTIDELYNVDVNFEHIVLINDQIFAGMKDNVYKIYSYNNLNEENNENTYNYIYAYNDIILTINNNKIDILDINLNSTLLMKIDTFFEYTVEKERDSLDIYSDEEFIYFKVYNNERDYVQYKYNILEKKII